MVDRGEVGTEAGFGRGAATSCMKRAVARAMSQFEDGLRRQLDGLAQAFQRDRIGDDAASTAISSGVVHVEVGAELAEIVAAVAFFLRLAAGDAIVLRRTASSACVSFAGFGVCIRRLWPGLRRDRPAPVPIGARLRQRSARFRIGVLVSGRSAGDRRATGTGAVAGRSGEAARQACAVSIADQRATTAVPAPLADVDSRSPRPSSAGDGAAAWRGNGGGDQCVTLRDRRRLPGAAGANRARADAAWSRLSSVVRGRLTDRHAHRFTRM